jgi:hypothetical protein
MEESMSSDDDLPIPASSAAPMPESSLTEASLDDLVVAGQRAVIVASYSSPIEAELAKSRLAAEGLRCDLQDLHTVSIGTHLALAVGGVKLRVLEEDVEAARELLADLGEMHLALPDEDDDDDELELRPRGTPKELANRALMSGIIGALFFPPLNLYSLWLAGKALARSEAETASFDVRWRAGVAVAVDLVGLAWITALIGGYL